MKKDFLEKGFTKIFYVDLGTDLKRLQEKIYSLTSKLLINHDPSIEISKRIQLPFKQLPTNNDWSEIMNKINDSEELKLIINSRSVISAFKEIQGSPQKFSISTFRCRFPDQSRSLYNWHQDEGTWYLSKNKNVQNKFPATMWFSVNGASEKDSIQLVTGSHKKKLFDHKYVEGQGFFTANVKEKEIDMEKIFTVKTKPSEAIIFHPLMLHRSVPYAEGVLRPRYSIDLRYYDSNSNFKFDKSYLFYLKKLYRSIFK